MSKKIRKLISMAELYNKKRKVAEFEGEWKAFMGNPELRGTWIVWGASGNGKTSLMLQLAKYLTTFGPVLYNSLEEGDSQTFELACRRENMMEVKSRFHLSMDEKEELLIRLRSKRAPKIVIIDSYQYLNLSYKEYKTWKAEFTDTLFIFISHADGRLPSGRPANSVRYDADVKIRVENYVAMATSRYGGGEPYIIWEEKAQELGAF